MQIANGELQSADWVLVFHLEVLPLKFELTFKYSSLKTNLLRFSALTPNFSYSGERTEIKIKARHLKVIPSREVKLSGL